MYVRVHVYVCVCKYVCVCMYGHVYVRMYIMYVAVSVIRLKLRSSGQISTKLCVK